MVHRESGTAQDTSGWGAWQMISHVAVLFGFWVAMSGFLTPYLLSVGLGAAIGVAWLTRRMAVADREGHPIHFLRAVVGYWPWLLKEILRSGLTVTRIVLSPRLPISPTVVRFRPSQHSATGLATHANSITLTPGTITVAAENGEFLVHGLTSAGAHGCIDSDMDRRIRRLEGERT